ncbi:peptide/nickel transport system permease protein [Roseomonas rosea]|uniref:Peptide/nickel transport system permease protein n=1 Tax=Muricoccus roseus TaxID=198092 RepID=A0A1M6N0I0_9PROT|nr:ABC transporter permease [Roseomonas rosea]SHJ89220.1 peptide/nickel transport system permease protein [Roseomonas rosea]
MIEALLRRIGAALITAVLATGVVFLLIRAVPGDAIGEMLGQSAGDPAAEAALRAFFGLDQPIWSQYLRWAGDVLRGDLGTSMRQGLPVWGIVMDAFLVTLQIGLVTLLLAALVGVPLGLAAGARPGGMMDMVVESFTLLSLSSPVFWTGMVLLIMADAWIGWAPPLVYTPPEMSLADNLESILLPVLALGFLQAGAYAQFTRQQTAALLRQDFVRAATARGLPARVIFGRHVLRNIAIPLLTYAGLILVQILGGVVVVETLFAIPGLGRTLLAAIQGRDYPVLQGALLFTVVVALLVNLLVDLAYALIDPRVRGA